VCIYIFGLFGLSKNEESKFDRIIGGRGEVGA
jgi:hypothetical protein